MPRSRARALRLAAVIGTALLVVQPWGSAGAVQAMEATHVTYDQLVRLFEDWRRFEASGGHEGAPDYRPRTMAAKHAALRDYQSRLRAIDPSGWPVEQQVDYHLVRAEMNGLDFNIRVLRPWERDPAFYQTVWTSQSDTPEHEGPMHHAPLELWTYSFPLDAVAERKIVAELRTIPPLLTQARGNLTGNARDLWIAGTETMRRQSAALGDLAERSSTGSAALATAIAEARAATDAFVGWLESQAGSKTGPSGVGKENYTWYLRNVHLVPLSWEEEVSILRRELSRAHAALRLEEHRNRNLPPLSSARDAQDYERRARDSVRRYMEFIRQNDILTVEEYMEPQLLAHLGSYVPPERQNFFHLAMHREPMTLWTHFYHWWDLARMREKPHPSPIRRGALLYNIWDSRAEGTATAMEEMMMHAGLYDDNPRVREIVWIMLAQRAARGLGSLYAHANLFTMKEAADFHVAWTPNGWMREDLDLLGFEQHLYMRQPGYGSSYLTGKHQIEKLYGEYAAMLGSGFSTRRFFDSIDEIGMIPVSLIRWQLTGRNDEINALQAD
jgi:hypothetical protein